MKRILGALAIGVFGLGVSAAQADAYLSLGYGHHEQDDRFYGHDRFKTGEAIAKLGGRVTDWFTVEMRTGTTVKDKKGELRGLGVDGKYRVNYFYGAYIKLGLPNASAFTPYVIGGYTEGKEEMKTRLGNEDQKFYDSSYGAGLDMDLTQRVGLNLEYMFYYDKDNVTLKGPSLSAVWKF